MGKKTSTSRKDPPFDYSPIVDRPRLTWPGDARVAVWIIPNVEYFRYDLPSPAALNPVSAAWIPDVPNYSWRDYGIRVGVWRMLEVMRRYSLRGTVALNSDVCRYYPRVVEEFLKSEWELMGHGTTNSIRLYGQPRETEVGIIHEALETIEKFSGKRPLGWLGPGLAESTLTLDLLAAAGVKYVGDWVNDDQPYWFRLERGNLLAMPYSMEVNDLLVCVYTYGSPEDFVETVKAQFDVLYEEGEQQGRAMGIALHPYIIGVPFRIKALDRALNYIIDRSDVWLATGSEIASWYERHFPPARQSTGDVAPPGQPARTRRQKGRDIAWRKGGRASPQRSVSP